MSQITDGWESKLMVMLIPGDAKAVLAALEDKSVQCVVTSPPYWGLRDYGVDGQLGLEKTPEEYVEKMVEVFREVRRVLRDDGTLWLNIGDSYNASGGSHTPEHANPGISNSAKRSGAPGRNISSLKPKDLVGIPWRLAFALQADGWWLRQDIIWAKPNPMPESVKDRCTKAHEYLFMFSKKAKYYYDAEAIKEPETMKPQRRLTPREDNPNAKVHGQAPHRRPEGGTGNGTRNKRSVWTIPTSPFPEAHFATFPPKLVEPCILSGSRPGDTILDPFVGSGTVCMVAEQHRRHSIGIDLKQEYLDMARARIERYCISG